MKKFKKNNLNEINSRIKDLENKSNLYGKGQITKDDYSLYLKEQIKDIKNKSVDLIKRQVKEDLKEIEILKAIKNKINKGVELNEFENKYISLNF